MWLATSWIAVPVDSPISRMPRFGIMSTSRALASPLRTASRMSFGIDSSGMLSNHWSIRRVRVLVLLRSRSMSSAAYSALPLAAVMRST